MIRKTFFGVQGLLAFLFIGIVHPVCAQSDNGVSVGVANPKTVDSYNRFSVGYNSNKISYDTEDGDVSMDGFVLQLVKGEKVADLAPVYLEYGLRLTYGYYSEDDYVLSRMVSLTKVSIAVPLNLGYKMDFSDNASIMPYVGLHGMCNLKGKLTVEGEDLFDTYSEDYSMFNKKHVGRNLMWKRIQCGWQIGANVSFSRFSVGVEYGEEFNELAKKCSSGDLNVSVGYKF